MVKRVELHFISWELMKGQMAEANTGQGGPPGPTQREKPTHKRQLFVQKSEK